MRIRSGECYLSPQEGGGEKKRHGQENTGHRVNKHKNRRKWPSKRASPAGGRPFSRCSCPGTAGTLQRVLKTRAMDCVQTDFFPSIPFSDRLLYLLPPRAFTPFSGKKNKGLWKRFFGNSYLPAFLWQVTLSPMNISKSGSWQGLKPSPAACYASFILAQPLGSGNSCPLPTPTHHSLWETWQESGLLPKLPSQQAHHTQPLL